MNRRSIVIVLLCLLFVLLGCNRETVQKNATEEMSTGAAVSEIRSMENESITAGSDLDKVEIIHFHATRQCYSCKTLGAYAEETVKEYFKDEVKANKVSFMHINVDLFENSEIVSAYGARGSSLWIGTYSEEGHFDAQEDVKVWYKIEDKQGFMEYLRGIIEKKIRGE